jgi:hypothetical protein
MTILDVSFMQKPLRYLILPLIVILTSCASGNVEQTLVAQNDALSTQMADLYATATVDADNMMLTLENAQAQLTNVQFQSVVIAGTLVARGVDPTALAMFTPQGSINFAQQPTQPVNSASQGGATIFAPTPEGARGTATPDPSLIQPQTTEAATVVTGATLYNLVMSTGVDSNDCAIDQMTQFSTANVEIYIVARTQGIRSGMNLLSRWSLNGTEQISHDFTPDSDIPDDRCVWFFIDQGEVTFSPGNWSVQLEVDGVPVASTQFTITP